MTIACLCPAFAQTTATPAITAITNAASYYAGEVSPGAIIVLWGRNLGPTVTVSAPGGGVGSLLPTRLSNTSVTVEGYPAPLLYASDTQVALVVPYEASLFRTIKFIVTNGAARSNVKEMEVAVMTLGLFTSNSSGIGLAAAVNQDGSIVSFGKPADDDSYISLYATGEGLLLPFVAAGRFTNELSYAPQKPIDVYIDNRLAQTSYIGVAPYSITGFLQINARVPRGVPTGTVPVRLEAAGPYRSQDGVSLIVQNRSNSKAASLKIEIGNLYNCQIPPAPGGFDYLYEFRDCNVDVTVKELQGVSFSFTSLPDIYSSRYGKSITYSPIQGGGTFVIPLVHRFRYVNLDPACFCSHLASDTVKISIRGADSQGNRNFNYFVTRAF